MVSALTQLPVGSKNGHVSRLYELTEVPSLPALELGSVVRLSPWFSSTLRNHLLLAMAVNADLWEVASHLNLDTAASGHS